MLWSTSPKGDQDGSEIQFLPSACAPANTGAPLFSAPSDQSAKNLSTSSRVRSKFSPTTTMLWLASTMRHPP